MQQYVALPAAVTVPFAALYMAFYDTKHALNDTVENSCNCSRPLRLKVIGSGQSVEEKLSALDIPENNQTKIINALNSLKLTDGNVYCGFADIVTNMCVNFLNDIPGHSWSLLLNLILLLAFQMTMKYSVIGIFLKIVLRNISDFLWYCYQRIMDVKLAIMIRLGFGGSEILTETIVLEEKEEVETEVKEELESITKSLQEIYSTLLSEKRDEFAESQSLSIDAAINKDSGIKDKLDEKGVERKDLSAQDAHSSCIIIPVEKDDEDSIHQVSTVMDQPPEDDPQSPKERVVGKGKRSRIPRRR